MTHYEVLQNKSKALLDELGIKYAKKITWGVCNRKTAWGYCRRTTGGWSIYITKSLLEHGSDQAIMSTIVHELLHTTRGGHTHTGKWLYYACKVNKISKERGLGLVIERSTNAETKGIGIADASYAYIVKCPKCGQTFGYYKRCKTVSDIMHGVTGYSCGKCGTELTSVNIEKA